MVKYIPDRGDIIMLDFGHTVGHEQTGYRPAVVLSSNDFNQYTRMVMVLPISSNTKSFPTHYILKGSKKIQGAVLCEHIRSIDFDERKIKFVEKISNEDLEYVQVLFNLCLE